MSTVGTKLGWKDAAAATDPSGKTLEIVEMMDEVNPVLGDIPMVPGNQGSTHMMSVRDGIPDPTFRRLNRGTPVTKATEHAIEFGAAIVEDRGEIDEILVARIKEKEKFRLRQNKGHIQGIGQTLASTLFYGDVEANADRFTGLSAFYSDLAADSGDNVIDAGGNDSDLTSMWLILWNEDTNTGFYPDGGKAGIEHQDKGLEKCFDSDSNPLYKFVDIFRAQMGLAWGDWRQGARIANLDLSALATAGDETDTSANLLKFAIQAKGKIFNTNVGKGYWYARREVKTALDIKARNKPNLQINMATLANGDQVTMLEGYPVHLCDALLPTESRVV